MKKLLIAVLFFAACGGKTKDRTASSADTSDQISVKPPTNPILGTPKKLDTLEVAEFDNPDMKIWDEAVRECEALGKGWRLPTKEELNNIFQQRETVGNFSNDFYWYSDESNAQTAGIQNFFNGQQGRFSKVYAARSRAVRTQ